MATYLAHIRIKDGCEERFERTIADLARDTNVLEPRVHRYEYWRGQEPSTYYALGSWADYLAFIDHQTSDHHEDARTVLREVIDDIRLEWVDPVPSASPLSPSASQDVGVDASPRARHYHEQFPMQEPAWWRHSSAKSSS